MQITIKHRYTNNVLCALQAIDIKDCVQQAIKLRVDLRCADLRGADLRGIFLNNVNLGGSDLSYADLREADLNGIHLNGADLTGTKLEGANLDSFKTDIFDVLLRAPKELAQLRHSLVTGKIVGYHDGRKYASLTGILSSIRQCSPHELGNGIVHDYSKPAEEWFNMIKKGDTPKTNIVSKIAVDWIDEFTGLLETA